MLFIIVMTVFSVVFVVISSIELIESVKAGRVGFGTLPVAIALVGGCFCLSLVIAFPIAASELERTEQELLELKEQKKIESVYEPVNEVLYRKCK